MSLEKLYKEYIEFEEQADAIADEIIAYSKKYGTDSEKLYEKLSHNSMVRKDIILPSMVKMLVEKELNIKK